MDWCFDSRVPGARASLQAEVVGHLRRHALDELTLVTATPQVAAALQAAESAGGWFAVTLDWEGPTPHMAVRPLAGPPPPEVLAGGPAAGVGRLHDRPELLGRRPPQGDPVEVALTVLRTPEPDIDPPPVDVAVRLDPASFPGEVLSLVSSATAAGRDAAEAAAVAGASIGAAFEADWRAATGTAGPLTARQVAEAFVELQHRAGGDFFFVSGDDRRAVLGNRRCPLGPSVQRAPELCRCTSAAIGQMAARAAGSARVTLPERLAKGDDQCRLVVELEDPVQVGPAPVSHRYHWPPAGLADQEDFRASSTGQEEAAGFRVDLSLELPRDRLSVPVVRHLAQDALEEVGVVEEDRADVELALTEACANVLDHSGSGEAYTVTVSVGLETCEIRVVDVGRGFDYLTLGGRQVEPEAESGRGIALMHALMDQVRFTSAPEKGTVVHLVKRLRFDDSSPARRLLFSLLDPGRGGGPDPGQPPEDKN